MPKQDILYNGAAVLSGLPTPFIGRSVEYIQAGERWGQKEVWTMNGFVPGCSESELLSGRLSVLNDFSGAFGPLQIGDQFDFDWVRVTNVTFEDSEYIAPLSYTIEFERFAEESFDGVNFSGFYGVLDPSDSISYQENPDRTMTMTRSISARGFSTSGDDNAGLNNVKAFMAWRSGETIRPFIISYTGTNLQFYLESSEETFDRITNRGTLSQTFKTDLDDAVGNVIHRYTRDQSDQVGEITSVTYQGQIDAGKYGAMASCRTKYLSFKSGIGTTFWLTESVTEDPYINRLTYNFSFLSGSGMANIPEVEDDFTITVNEDSNTSLLSASINGGVRTNYGCIEERFTKASGVLRNARRKNYHFDIVNSIYEGFYSTTYGSMQNKPSLVDLHYVPLNSEESLNLIDNTISYAASWNDRFIPEPITGASEYSDSIYIQLPINVLAIKENYAGGKYTCQDLGYVTREVMGVASSHRGSTGTMTGWNINLFEQFKRNDEREFYESNDSLSRNIAEKTESHSMTKSYNNAEDVFEL